MQRKPQVVSGVFEKTPNSGVWYIRYRKDGRLIRKRIGSKDQAVTEICVINRAKKAGVRHP